MEIWHTSSVVKYISLQFTTLLCEITNKEVGCEMWKCGLCFFLLASFVLLWGGSAQLCNCAIRHLIVCTLMLSAIFLR